MKLSIIIPVYNTENYLAKCLQSVCDQNLPKTEYEIIVINDGSTDGSRDIILDFKEKHNNIIFIDQENKGVSAARNAGLEIVKGEFVTFVDADDSIEKNSLYHIIEQANKFNLDILYPIISAYSESGEKLDVITFTGNYGDIKKGIFQERRTYASTFYRNNLLNSIRFNESISFGEDTVFNVQAQALALRVTFAEISYYKYTVRKNSLSKQGYSDIAFVGFMSAIKEIYHFQQQYFYDDLRAKSYFDNVYETFATRIIELNIMLTWNRTPYNELVALLTDNNLRYILDLFEQKYPYIAFSFTKFKIYQYYLTFKSQIYKLIYRA